MSKFKTLSPEANIIGLVTIAGFCLGGALACKKAEAAPKLSTPTVAQSWVEFHETKDRLWKEAEYQNWETNNHRQPRGACAGSTENSQHGFKLAFYNNLPVADGVMPFCGVTVRQQPRGVDPSTKNDVEWGRWLDADRWMNISATQFNERTNPSCDAFRNSNPVGLWSIWMETWAGEGVAPSFTKPLYCVVKTSGQPIGTPSEKLILQYDPDYARRFYPGQFTDAGDSQLGVK